MLSNIFGVLLSNTGLRWLLRAVGVAVFALVGALIATLGDLGLSSAEGGLVGALLSFLTQVAERYFGPRPVQSTGSGV